MLAFKMYSYDTDSFVEDDLNGATEELILVRFAKTIAVE